MSTTNLIDLIKGQFGPSTISQTATQLGESESGISKSISVLLPAIIGGLVNSNARSELFTTVKEASNSGILSNLLNDNSGNESIITRILHLIFGSGDRLEAITSAVSEYSGIRKDSTNSLMNIVAASTVGTIGRYVTENNLDSSSFDSTFRLSETVI